MNYSRNYGRVLEHVQPIVPQLNHTILYDLQTLTPNQPPKPHDKWSQNNQLVMVNLPHLKSNKFITQQHGGGYSSKWLWQVIGESLLSKDIKNSYGLEKAILKYNDVGGKFRALHYYCEQMENNLFFQETLPAIINLALKLPSLIKTGIPLLKHGLNHSISLSQEQIACLLANAFLCTFPDKRSQKNSGQSFPDINFNRLFQSERYHVAEKIKCIVNYFDRVTKNMPTGVVTFIRRSVGRDHLPDWSKTNIPISKTTLKIMPNGKIEDDRELLQVDFANKYIGGGVIGGGCVQEEIQFITSPELIVSRLFTEFLKDNEALIIAGAEQFSNHIGYANSFKFAGSHRDTTPIDHDSKRRRCYIVAIDALSFSNTYTQYEKKFIKRELNKAYVGFYHPLKDSTPPGVATGNWGCGAFKGDPQLKSLIQLMACAITKRPLHYFTCGNTRLTESLNDIYNYLKDNNMNTLQLWEYMNEFKYKNKNSDDLFTFIKRRHRSGQESFYNDQDDHEKNSKNFKLEIETKTKPPKTTPYSHSQKSNQTYVEVTNKGSSLSTNEISKNSYSAGAPMEQSHRTPTSQCEGDNKTNFHNHNQKSNQTYAEVKTKDYCLLTNEISKNSYSAGALIEQSHSTPTSQYERDNKTNFHNHNQKSNQTYAEVKNKDYSLLTNEISKNSYSAGAPMEQSHRTLTSQYERDNKTNFHNHNQKSNQTYAEVKNKDYSLLTNEISKNSYIAGAPMEQSHRTLTSQYERDNKTNFHNHNQKSNQTYAEVKNKDYSLTNEISKTSYSAGAPMEQSHRTSTSQYERDNKTNFPYHNQISNQTYAEVQNKDYSLLTNEISKNSYSAGALMEQSHRTPTSQYERNNKTNFPNQINSFQNNLQDEDVLMEECENNKIANNQKVKESYNKQSNSSISSDCNESEKKCINDIIKLYETTDKNKAKQTSSHGFNLGNDKIDYSTTYCKAFGTEPISTNQTKYVQQNSNLTNEESASCSSVYFNRNEGNNNFNSGFNKVEFDIFTQKEEEVT